MMGLSSCKHQKNETPIADLIESRLDQSSENENQIEIELIDFTTFEWDEVLIFNYPTTKVEIEEALGVSYEGATDLTSGMVFVKDRQITHLEYFDYDYNGTGKFMIYSQTEIGAAPHYRVFSKKDAVFFGKKGNVDKESYYRLYPSS